MIRALAFLLLTLNLYAISSQEVFTLAKQYTKYPSTIVAIVQVESTNGKFIVGDDGKSLGITQLQVATIRWLATKDRKLRYLDKVTDLQLRTLLIRNEELCILITSRLINYYIKRYGYFEAISRYNGGRKNYVYYNKIITAKNQWLNNKSRGETK